MAAPFFKGATAAPSRLWSRRDREVLRGQRLAGTTWRSADDGVLRKRRAVVKVRVHPVEGLVHIWQQRHVARAVIRQSQEGIEVLRIAHLPVAHVAAGGLGIGDVRRTAEG